MEEIYLLGVDVGTSSIKVTVIDQEARFVAQESAAYRLINPNQVSIQIDTADMWNAFTGCVGALISKHGVEPGKIKAIGISSLCPGLAAFNADGRVLVDPIIYSDRRSTEEAEIFRQTIGNLRLFEITANSPMAGAMSGTSMLWIKRNLPEIYEKTRYFGHVNTLIAVMLSGNFAIDHSNASYTLLYETAGRGVWSEEICGKIGIDIHKLPPLVKSTDVVGNLIHPVLLAMGLSRDQDRHRRRRHRLRHSGGRCGQAGRRVRVGGHYECADRLRGGAQVLSQFHQPPPCGGWSLDLSGLCPTPAPPTSGYMTTSIRTIRITPPSPGSRA